MHRPVQELRLVEQLPAPIQVLVHPHIAVQVVPAALLQVHLTAEQLLGHIQALILHRIVVQVALVVPLQVHLTVVQLLHRKVVRLILSLPNLIN